MRDDPTEPEFFALWSIRKMQVELARLNKVLAEISEIADGKMEDKCELCGEEMTANCNNAGCS